MAVIYLIGRKQYVKVDNTLSYVVVQVLFRVAQNSHLGPKHFLIFLTFVYLENMSLLLVILMLLDLFLH